MNQEFLKITTRGLYCEAGGFYLDPKLVVNHAVITHAHSDHAVRGNKNVYCTAPTSEFMKLKFGNKNSGVYHVTEFGKTFQLGNVSLTLYPAGHILGSAQVLMEHNRVKYLYTGDFKLTDDNSCEAFEFVSADVLYMETTFASPSYSHPEPGEEISKLNEMKGMNILIGAYSLGKAQRVTQLVTKHCPEKKVIVHSNAVPFHRIYESFSYSLGGWDFFSQKLLRDSTDIVYIVPPSVYNKYLSNKTFLKTFATGWKQFYRGNDFTLTISDHADWKELHTLISHVKAKTIFTLHGDGSRLKKFFDGQATNVILMNGKKKEEAKTLSLFSDEYFIR
ncbi:MAG TPA: MBL fold metallo-hydrolase [Bacteroidia bacterium]|nr:MBL fold metallo-hydrolase [Bacteroidia bacterium]